LHCSSDLTFKQNKVRGSINARDIFQRDDPSRIVSLKAGKGPTLYPNEVVCYIFTEVFHYIYQTFTASHTSTITEVQPTSTLTATAVITSTVFVSQVDATLLSTIFETSTATETVIPYEMLDIFTTTTVTNIIPIETAYAACQPNNFADSVDGTNLSGLIIGSMYILGFIFHSLDVSRVVACSKVFPSLNVPRDVAHSKCFLSLQYPRTYITLKSPI